MFWVNDDFFWKFLGGLKCIVGDLWFLRVAELLNALTHTQKGNAMPYVVV